MRFKLIAAATVLSVLAVGALAGSATAGGGADTKVTIKAESGGFYGYVKSSKNKCANNRVVHLYKQKGKKQKPKVDEKVASDTSSKNGDRYQWSTGNTGIKGKFYAKTGKKSGCKNDRSPTIRSEQ